jgi:hypothetical protein
MIVTPGSAAAATVTSQLEGLCLPRLRRLVSRSRDGRLKWNLRLAQPDSDHSFIHSLSGDRVRVLSDPRPSTPKLPLSRRNADELTGVNYFAAAAKHLPPQTEPCRCIPKTRLFCDRPTPFCPARIAIFSPMVNKRKERPCDSVPADRRCRVCCNPRHKMPCEGPLPETSEAEPGGSCSSPTSESTSSVTTRSGRIVIVPTRLAEDDDYVEQLGPLRDQRDQPCKAPDHVTKDAQIEALTAEVSELHE